MTDISVGKRHEKLYGKSRANATHGEEVRRTLSSSHVLQPGEYNYSPARLGSEVWRTTSSIDFTGSLSRSLSRPETTADDRTSVCGKQQLSTHFQLGNDSGRLLSPHTYTVSATQQDFTSKVTERPDVVQENRTVNWPDMAPQYTVDRTLGSTEYKGAFLDKALPRETPIFPRINTSKMELPLQHASLKKIAVSVDLGSDPNQFGTEMGQSYGTDNTAQLSAMRDEAQEVTRSMRELDRKSNVFRAGDYNNIVQDCSSIFTLDYCKKMKTPTTGRFITPSTDPPLNTVKLRRRKPARAGDDSNVNNSAMDSDEDEEVEVDNLTYYTQIPKMINYHLKTTVPAKFKEASDGRQEHIAAHFKLGSDDAQICSVYDKDFHENSGHGGSTPRPAHSSGPPDSAVLQRDPERDAIGHTTSGTEFGPQSSQMGFQANEDMRTAALRNMMRRHGNNVVLTYDREKHRLDRQSSLSRSSYTGPPSDYRAMKALSAPPAAYNYLETDVALSFPVPKAKITENKYNYSGCLMDAHSSIKRRLTKDEQTRSRASSGRSTHFVFGSDLTDYGSENLSNFSRGSTRAGVLDVPAAGKVESAPGCQFNHLGHSSNTQELVPNPYKVSIMETLEARRRAVSRSRPTLGAHTATVMMNDYCGIDEQQMTPAQLMVIRQNTRLQDKPIARSHFFHTDSLPGGGNNFQTTTMTDFMQPDLSEGRKLLAAR